MLNQSITQLAQSLNQQLNHTPDMHAQARDNTFLPNHSITHALARDNTFCSITQSTITQSLELSLVASPPSSIIWSGPSAPARCTTSPRQESHPSMSLSAISFTRWTPVVVSSLTPFTTTAILVPVLGSTLLESVIVRRMHPWHALGSGARPCGPSSSIGGQWWSPHSHPSRRQPSWSTSGGSHRWSP